MKTTTKNPWLAKLSWATLAITLLGGCATTSKPINHYLMSPIAPLAAPSPVNLALGIGPVTLAHYLRRQNIVARESPTRVRIASNDRWAAPLDAHLSALLATNLRRRLGLSRISTFPWPQAACVDYQLTVHVARFIYDADRVHLDARWRFLDNQSSVVAEHFSGIEERCGPDYDSIVDAMSRAVGGLSDEIAEVIHRDRSKSFRPGVCSTRGRAGPPSADPG
uniref:ABC-type transport auxiliary lipoprotein component domain-containing protein n=1 Tax=Candidatus Kentrum sp. SD TaxID=2126332 RepID=A0A451BNT8_9GAMM|nr:MAG: hypothetical protein BECKSD772D_GA0070982_107514 [Candidatus Kentron sp. SD]